MIDTKIVNIRGLLTFFVLIVPISMKNVSQECRFSYSSRALGLIYCTMPWEESESFKPIIECEKPLPSEIISVDKTIELSFAGCPIKPGMFTSLPHRDVSAFSFDINQYQDKRYNYSRIDSGVKNQLKNNSFQGICGVSTMKLSGYYLNRIEPAALNCLSTLHHLDLSQNLLESVPGYIFQEVDRLKVLDLQHNRIRTLTQNSFYGLLNIEKVVLRNNNLTIVNGSAFKGLKNVKTLELSENIGLKLSDDLFRELENLETLVLDGCNISSLPDNVFRENFNLKYLYLHRNRLTSLTKRLFDSLGKLYYMSAASNEISILDNGTFINNFDLQFLYLKNNSLSRLDKDNFEGLYSLRTLDLSRNIINYVASFEYLKRLKNLNLSHNFLSSLPGLNPFEFNSELVTIDMSYNLLTDITNVQWQNLEYLENLVLTYNKITQFLIPEIYYSPTIHLQRNEVQTIYVNQKNLIRIGSTGNMRVHLEKNPLMCGCNMYELYSAFNEMQNRTVEEKTSLARVQFTDGLMCQLPLKHLGRLLYSLTSSDFTCASCPDRCDCDFSVYNFIENTINCSSRDYDILPVVTSPNASVLHINQNNLTTLVPLNENCWAGLIELQAEDNRITSEEFYVPQKLRYLGLRNNHMTTLPKTVRTHAKNTREFRMTLSHNLWPCDCTVLPFKDFLFTYQAQVIDINEIRCLFPNKSANSKPLISMENAELCYQYSLNYLTIFSYVTGVCFIVLCLVLAFYYKNKAHILSFMYTHCNSCYMVFCCDQPNNDDRLFDCFISYSSVDVELTFAIIEELEKKPPYYHFCVHERNWTPGEFITKNIVNSVQNSRKTLIILSKDFVKSPWFHLEFQAAYNQGLQDKRNRLVFVLKGDLPDTSELEADVQYVLSTITYLKWGERWFWQKLKYALHDKSFSGFKQNWSFEEFRNCFKRQRNARQSAISLQAVQNSRPEELASREIASKDDV